MCVRKSHEGTQRHFTTLVGVTYKITVNLVSVSFQADLQVIWPIKHGIICREKLIQNDT